ncbi:hypothetical protein NEOC95_000519 [Neochlamydia sp. AcF95]|nr:hypothetical protein [Neochlamydia sp. AcF95]
MAKLQVIRGKGLKRLKKKMRRKPKDKKWRAYEACLSNALEVTSLFKKMHL